MLFKSKFPKTYLVGTVGMRAERGRQIKSERKILRDIYSPKRNKEENT